MFATVEDLATFLGTDFSAAESATATQNLEIATQVIKDYTGQVLEAEAADAITLDGNGESLLQLPEAPVTAVTSVTLNGILLTEATDYAWYASGLLEKLHGGWGSKWQSIDVVYSHGYAAIPDAVKGVCLAMAGRLMERPVPIEEESIGAYSVSYSAGAEQLSDEEKHSLSSYRAILLA